MTLAQLAKLAFTQRGRIEQIVTN